MAPGPSALRMCALTNHGPCDSRHSGYAVDVKVWLNRLPVLGYIAVMAMAPVLGFLAAWVHSGFPSAPVAVELVLYCSVPFALVMTLAREVHRRRGLEGKDHPKVAG